MALPVLLWMDLNVQMYRSGYQYKKLFIMVNI